MIFDALLDRFEGQDGRAIMESLDDDAIMSLLELDQEELDEARFGKFRYLFPDKTITVGGFTFFARDLYPKHLELFAASAKYRSRCFMAANRVGKTVAGAYEVSCHLTGDYPAWWPGKKFRHPIRAWACGKTNETTRDIVQTTLLGEIEYHGSRKVVDGSGVCPRERIGTGAGQLAWKQGVQDLIDTVKIKHVSGGWSKLGFKSYQQGRGAFEGTAQHVVWNDEEPPMDIYGEQIIRTATTGGIMLLTFTPLAGMSDVVKQFL